MTNQTAETTIVTDRFGNVDVAYYEREAMRLRNEYLRTQAGDFFISLRRGIHNLFGSSATPSNA
ncbi:RSP_7527 family protein [Saccharospirillum sp.]|uniref:RSP_7527 family protein n=1 Tax=Saccharospirillum sp. TaxID=2033801 RepID=UPI00349FF7E3